MIGYATVGSNVLARAEPFYTELLGTQGMTKLFDHPRDGVIFARGGKPAFGVPQIWPVCTIFVRPRCF